MKKIACLLLIISSFSVKLFSQKIVYLNSKEIVDASKEAKKLDSSYNTYLQILQKEFNTRLDSYKQNVSKFNSDSISFPLSVKAIKKVELETDLKNIQEFSTNAQKDLEEYKQKLFGPLQKRIVDTINSIAKEKGYDYILDISTTQIVYVNEKNNITKLVIHKLGNY